ncbi:MAG: hypothetical protein JXB48_00980 [Candidatus Latescibacteria bacterium]|nr:hypothetical protein [Candidatus Latescibacterota bacterium]
MDSSHQGYKPPDNLWDVYDLLKFNEPLESNDPMRVDTESGRGKFNFTKLYRYLSVDTKTYQFQGNKPPKKIYIAFCGHRGCGKSTELKRLASILDREGLFLVVFLNASEELDTNNLEYADVFMALAKKLIEKLEELSLSVNPIYIKKLESWFKQSIIVNAKIKDYAMEIQAGVSAKSGIPFLGNIFANITSKIKNNATYKEELREVVTNAFSLFAEGFNELITAIRDILPVQQNRQDILFIVDDLEKLPMEKAKDIFINNINQLQQINSNFIYSTPIGMLSEGIQLQQFFQPFTLPMIKIVNKDGSNNPDGYKVLRDMIFKRADRSLFESESLVDKIIEYSGGNPRHVIHLLAYAYSHAENDIFDKEAVDSAIDELAVLFQRFLTKEDYDLLCHIDKTGDDTPSERARNLLYHLALLEYNAYWWKSHPAVQKLTAYKKCYENSGE